MDFYGELVQQLRAWQPRAPKLRDDGTSDDETEQPIPDPPAFSAPSRDIGEATDPHPMPRRKPMCSGTT